jgi:hypothetical protein
MKLSGASALARLGAIEPWLPAIAGLLWWITFHPGFISEDSLINLTDARSGAISVWFTAWWVYIVDALTLGTRVIPLMTLISVMALEYAVYAWTVTVFPKTPARTISVLIIALTPVVGAMGIQIRHDVALTAGLLLCAAAMSRTWATSRLEARDLFWLALAAPLIATRHNGVPTLIAAALFVLLTGLRRWRLAAGLAAVGMVATLITFAATKASANANPIDPVQTVEWLMGDISCLLGRSGAEPSASEWQTLERIAPRSAWPQADACRVMNPMLLRRNVNYTSVVANYRELFGVWRSLGTRYPLAMTAAHASRVRLFLPPMRGYEIVSFLHSTIEPNDFGLHWTFPALAERARVMVRAWNAIGFIAANSMLWLTVLMLAAWRVPEWRDRLMPAIVIGIALNLGLLATAPISEGRYGLFILICGQSTAVMLGAQRESSR